MARNKSTPTNEEIVELFLNCCVSKNLETLIRRAARLSNLSLFEIIANGAFQKAYKILEQHDDPLRHANNPASSAWKQERRLGGVA